MIVIAGRIAVKPERRAEAERAALAMVEETRREAGCRAYAFYADLVDPATLFVFEEWDSDEAIAAHFQTEHMARFQALAPALLAAPPELERYVVAEATAM